MPLILDNFIPNWGVFFIDYLPIFVHTHGVVFECDEGTIKYVSSLLLRRLNNILGTINMDKKYKEFDMKGAQRGIPAFIQKLQHQPLLNSDVLNCLNVQSSETCPEIPAVEIS